MHLVAANARTAITFALSPGNAHDAPEGRALLTELGPMPEGLPMLMDRAYEGDETRQLVLRGCYEVCTKIGAYVGFRFYRVWKDGKPRESRLSERRFG